MKHDLSANLQRWQRAGLLEEAQAARIVAFEAGQPAAAEGLALPSLLALACGALLVAVGTQLFVGAHWDQLGPAARFAWALAPVALFHLVGAWASRRTPRLAAALHGVGTVLLGAGVFLTAQIFGLQEHWPAGLLLWALGAWLGFALLRDWVQGLLAALLTPWWLGSEWVEAARFGTASLASGALTVPAVGGVLLALTYLSLRRDEADAPVTRALAWLGGLALLPCVILLTGVRAHGQPWGRLPWALAALGWAVALGGPLALAACMRGRRAWSNGLAALWAIVLPLLGGWGGYAWCALGATGLVGWGLLEGRRERVNLGMAGFALAVGGFYWSSVMGRLGRSLGLLGLGLLFLAGGWSLEQLRRRLTAALGPGASR
jgi:hypothetical protein